MTLHAFSRVLILMPFAAVAVLLPGCGTCVRGQSDGVYRSTKMDALFLFCGLSPASIIGDAHASPVVEGVTRTGFAVGGVVDLPVSLVVDTVLLPYDLKKDRERIARRQARLRPLEEIIATSVPPGAQILGRPPDALGPYLLAPYDRPIRRPLGEGFHYSIDEPGAHREYCYPGEPGAYIESHYLEDRAGGMHLLVVLVRPRNDGDPPNKRSPADR